MTPAWSCHGVRCAAALSNRHSAAPALLVLGALVGLAAGIPQSLPVSAHGLETDHVEAESSHIDYTNPRVELHVSPRGDLVRREGMAAAGLADVARARSAGAHSHSDPADITQDGAVSVVSPAHTKSEQIKLEELNEDCMQSEPIAECMQKYGSYGVRKLFTESWASLKKLGYLRPDWMAHPEVQKRKIFDLTLPGTVNSGTYAITGEDAATKGLSPYGIVSQNLDFYQQLELGVRMFDIGVAYSSQHKMVYTSHQELMIPFATAMADIRRFLEEHPREVIVLDMHKDENAHASHLRPLRDEEYAMTRVPGQLVHEVVQCELKEMLATYSVLGLLPKNETAENPTLSSLVDIGGRVVYFWESQQVLCTSFDECKRTPGWKPASPQSGFPFAFGHPFELGKRNNATGGRKARMIEPACSTHSSVYTKDDQPEKLLKKIKIYSSDIAAKTLENRPKCFPAGLALPKAHTPTLWYTVDGFVLPKPEEAETQKDRMRGVKTIYTRGEGFNEETEAERTNYLMLSWFLKRDNQKVFTKSNAIMFEFAGSAAMPMLRVIEAMQARTDCGYAIYCKGSGSCWADTLLGTEDKCLSEEDVLRKLKDHAEGKEDNLFWIVVITTLVMSSLCLCAAAVCCFGLRSKMKGTEKPKEAQPLRRPSLGEASVQSSLPGSEIASDYEERVEEPSTHQS